jgi:LysM repeat protein
MKFRLFHVPLLLVVAPFFLLACNQEPDPTPEVPESLPIIEEVEIPAVEVPAVEPSVEPTESAQEVEPPTPPIEATPTPVNLPAVGSTVQHQVQVGDWLMQIARCYGTEYAALRRANPQIYSADYILPGSMVTVPNVGSVGEIKGSPCVAEYTVEAGETWLGLAEQFGTTAVILQRINPGPLLAGGKIIVPAHNIQVAAVETEPVSEVAPTLEPLSTEADPTRIQFAAGETSASMQGSVAANGEVTYIFTATEDQPYAVHLAPTQDDLLLTVENAEQTLPAAGVLPLTGDYIIRVRGGAVDATYSLELTVTNP